MVTLFSDLDGTFIPETRESEEDLTKIKSLYQNGDLDIVYVTGRDLEDTLNAIDEFKLPRVETIVCDVGTSIYTLENSSYNLNINYSNKLKEIASQPLDDLTISNLLKQRGIELQEDDNQKRFKKSFYYELGCEPVIDDLNNRWEAIVSSDNRRGFIDIVPRGVSKLFPIEWIVDYRGISRYIFAGDSGNDLKVFNSGFPSIVVGNSNVKNLLNHQSNVYISNYSYTSGVLDGLNNCFSI